MWFDLHARRRYLAVCLSLIFTYGCSPFGIVDNVDPSTDTLDPQAIKNQEGVLALYKNTVLTLSRVVAGSSTNLSGIEMGEDRSFVRSVAHVSDEADYKISTASIPAYSMLDVSTRNFNFDPLNGNTVYFDKLSRLRILAAETQAGFRRYGSLLSDTILGHSMAIEASSLIMLAELYCSGVPLSKLTQDGDFELTRGYSTEEVYSFALAKLDSASTLSRENARISGFIDLLRTRVLLGIGRIQDAARIANSIETSFRYSILYTKIAAIPTYSISGNYYSKFVIASVLKTERIGNLKGLNGLPYSSGHDPRVNLPELSDSWAPFVMSSGLEARLAQAEAALEREDPSWLTILNELRTSCATNDNCASPAPAGTGGISGLDVLDDPGNDKARLDLLFDERAYWLFLRGFRQGDLRRRIRVYGGSVSELYPIGLPEVGNVAYSGMVSLPVPKEEQRLNPKYRGCFHNDA